ncbi:MAG TPA: hypothetical protein VLE91_01925 [Candidatus Saccharimonadales bacterium]|nr:hypothetical protein [Candidatus Saccharimonadales bacterium]
MSPDAPDRGGGLPIGKNWEFFDPQMIIAATGIGKRIGKSSSLYFAYTFFKEIKVKELTASFAQATLLDGAEDEDNIDTTDATVYTNGQTLSFDQYMGHQAGRHKQSVSEQQERLRFLTSQWPQLDESYREIEISFEEAARYAYPAGEEIVAPIVKIACRIDLIQLIDHFVNLSLKREI